MSQENAKAFLKKTEEDKSLHQKLEVLHKSIIKLGADSGFGFSIEEFAAAYGEMYGELTDADMKKASGGLSGIQQKVPENP